MAAAGEPVSATDREPDPRPDSDPQSSRAAGGRVRYLAIITDGNGRWARAHGRSVNDGHSAGADTVKARLRDAAELGIEEFTVYSFSTENWSRPPAEVQGLMAMFSQRIVEETPELHEEGVRMRFIGRREGVGERLSEQMSSAEALTRANTRITMFVAFNYGGRAEIVDAARRFAASRGGGESAGTGVQGEGGRQADTGGSLGLHADEEEFRACLYAPEMHDPDLIIRTSGERRLSNYLLWQSAYSELVFREELWPDFTREALEESLAEYAERRRRFGGR